MNNEIFSPSKEVFILSSASVAGMKERNGPLGEYIDLCGDDKFGKDTWEKSESEMQRIALTLALNKSNLVNKDIDLLLAGDLINQCISSSFGLKDFDIPFFGLFGACSTCAEGMIMAAIYAGHVCDRCANVTSSHFCSAERQFRYPLEYGGQRPQTAQWTVTGSGAFVYSSLRSDLSRLKSEYVPQIIDVMPGKIIDHSIKDANNMGAAMAPAASDTLTRYFEASKTAPEKYDLIVTGDLGYEGSKILVDLMMSKNYDISRNHVDCGRMIYSEYESDTHAGGSGCGCSAVVMSSDILENIKSGKLKDILFMATGALMNSVSANQGQTIPGIAHLVHIRGINRNSAAQG